MKLSHLKAVLMAAIFISLAVVTPAFSQDDTSAPAAPQVMPGVPDSDALSQSKEVAIYGEVQAVDASANTLAVQYYDYDSDSEKTADIVVNADTKFENAPAIGDVKKSDWVDVTYVIKDGKKAAKMVTVEKEEAPASEEGVASPAASAVNLPLEQ